MHSHLKTFADIVLEPGMELKVTEIISLDGVDIIRATATRTSLALENKVLEFSKWQAASLKKSPLESIDINYKPLKDVLKCRDFNKEFLKEAYRNFRESYKQTETHTEDDAFALYLFNFSKDNCTSKGKKPSMAINEALSKFNIKELKKMSFYVMHVLHSLKNSPLAGNDEIFYRAFYAEDVNLKSYAKGKKLRWQEFSRVFKSEKEALDFLCKGSTEKKNTVIFKVLGKKLVHDISAFSYGSSEGKHQFMHTKHKVYSQFFSYF